MKVIVRCVNNRVTKTEMEREIERLFQENKDLRLSEAHLRDELNIIRQQSEVRRQIICERDKIVQELDEKNAELSEHIVNLESALDEAHANLAAAADATSYDSELEKQLDYYKKAASIWQEKAEAIQECREDAEARLRDTSNHFIKMYQKKVDNEKEAHKIIAELRDKLNDRNARVDELERRVTFLQTSNDGYIDVINEDLDRIQALEAELEIVTGDLAGEREDYADMEKELTRMTALASDYFEKWNALRNDEARAARFVKGIVDAMKIAVDDTAFSFEEIAEK